MGNNELRLQAIGREASGSLPELLAILRFGTPPATQVWLSYNAQGQLFVGSTFIAHLYRFIL
ncbi:hypothetical protein J4731_04480 [Providencia rettgeri]|nr:hypothetical protein [Providencia rettgeri]